MKSHRVYCMFFFWGGVFIITLESFKMVVVEDIYIANAGVHGPNPDRFLAAVKYIVEYQPRMEPWSFEWEDDGRYTPEN